MNRHCNVWCYTRFDTHVGNGRADTEVATGSGESWKANAVYRHSYKTPSVFRTLLDKRGPSAIVRRIILIAVKTINGVIWARLAPHVSQKCNKGGSPIFTNTNTSPSPVGVVLAFWVVATSLHSKPRLVFRAFVALSTMTVFDRGGTAFSDAEVCRISFTHT